MPVSRRHLLVGGAAALAAAVMPLRYLGAAAQGSIVRKPALNLGTFSGLVGSTFQMKVGSKQTRLRLAQATEGQKASPRGQSFSLLFEGQDGAILPQGTYAVTHPSLPEFPLFVVPMGQRQATPRYEAVFNLV